MINIDVVVSSRASSIITKALTEILYNNLINKSAFLQATH